jgi:exopolyphosphatase / guanosine-5'-triphosphate,3'-diphosphate pyrophosphatase
MYETVAAHKADPVPFARSTTPVTERAAQRMHPSLQRERAWQRCGRYPVVAPGRSSHPPRAAYPPSLSTMAPASGVGLQIPRILEMTTVHKQTSPKAADAADARNDPDAARSFPLGVAAIDVGSNAIRFVAAEFSDRTAYRVLAEERVPVRLGHDVFLTGRLAEEAQDAAVAAMQSFRARIEATGVGHYRAVATSAVREAANGEHFVERVRDEAGIDLEMITGAEEARLVHVAVRSRIPFQDRRWLLVDLGGGSVEVSLVDEHGIHWSESHTMGSVRLLEELSVAGAEPGRFRELLEEYTATLKIPYAAGQWRLQGLIATGGNIEALAKLGGCTPDRTGVSTLPVATLRSLIETLAQLSYRQRVDDLRLRADRADVILPAAMVYERVSTLAQVDSILVPHMGVKEGVLLDLVADLTSHRRHAERLEEQAYAGALVLGRRYMFDEAHGVQVAGLAVELFDQLPDLHGLREDERRILRAAAVLHDLGVYVSPDKHHKHSQYLIANSELPGFTPREIQMVAAVARYHRKGEPAAHHAEFMALDEQQRAQVVKLSALLRIAAALDKEHRQRITGIRARRKNARVVLELTGTGDLLLERWALQRNRTVFEKTYGVQLKISE